MHAATPMRLGLLFLALCASLQTGFAQQPAPSEDFLFPIKPGRQNYLSGNFGELRSNHFHGGLDIKTDYRTGLPVYSAADGYVSRIVVSSYGYGNVLFVTHPNGMITVYAHLEKFNYAISKFVKEQQYKNKLFDLDVKLPAYKFPVTRALLIAYSGNSGSSGGPHLHFEIRDTANTLYNPLFFGFKEIVDNIPPIITKLAIRPLSIDSRVNGEFSRYETPVGGKRGDYTLRSKIYTQGLIGLEVVTNDKQNGTGNLNGVACIELYLDGKEIFHYNMDKFPYEENPNVNVHLDYETLKKKGNYFQKCYKAAGNRLQNYNNKLNGKFAINDTLAHNVRIIVYDAYQNKSMLNFQLQGGNPEKIKDIPWNSKPIWHENNESFLKIILNDKNLLNEVGIFHIQGKPAEQKARYATSKYGVFLWDLRNGLPDSFTIGNRKELFGFANRISPNQVTKFSSSLLDIHFPKNALFDTFYLRKKSEVLLAKDSSSLNFEVHDPFLPLYSYVFLSVNAKGAIRNTDKYAAYYTSNGVKYLGGTWKDGTIDFKTKNLGKFSIRKDIKAPVIKVVKKNRKTVQVSIRDNLSGIKSFDGYINGEWVLFHYDHKKNLIWTDPTLTDLPLKGDLLIKVSDYCGNSSELRSKLK